ncbi:hypothetical protein RB195_014702 [Necator americanus]|uniref:Uncharacterized protein n=1 Tax=Necator americanus TaxID=51031 RepID=A0ABR1E176_NECAM
MNNGALVIRGGNVSSRNVDGVDFVVHPCIVHLFDSHEIMPPRPAILRLRRQRKLRLRQGSYVPTGRGLCAHALNSTVLPAFCYAVETWANNVATSKKPLITHRDVFGTLTGAHNI